MAHHEVFSHFAAVNAELPEGFEIDSYLGTKRRRQFTSGLPCGTNLDAHPQFDEEYFEWIDVLESVVGAKESYTMIELGAGFGPWAVRAAYAMRQYNNRTPYRLIAVEAEPTHFEWMRLHFADNGIDPAGHILIHAAISDAPGEVSFCVAEPNSDYKPSGWYGQSLTKDYEVVEQVEDTAYCGFQVQRLKSGCKSISVPSINLASILKDLRRVDLIDFDIQGDEASTIHSAIGLLNAKVKRLHIGTHSREIEVSLRELLSAHGWQCLADYQLGSMNETPWGAIQFQDGVQSWVNPRLSGP